MAKPTTPASRFERPAARTQNKPKAEISEETETKPLLANNFILAGVALAMIITGFCLMGGESTGMDAYNDDIFSTRRIVVGPCISFLGFVLMAAAIMVKPRDKRQKAEQ